MKKYSLFSAVLLFIPACAVLAQKNHSPAKPAVRPAMQAKTAVTQDAVIKDTFAWNIQTTLKRLQANILDDTRPAAAIVGGYIDTEKDRNVYSAIIKMPGAIESKVIREKVNRTAGYAEWEWQTTFFRTTDDQEIQRKQVDDIVKAMPAMKGGNEKNKVESISVAVSSISYVVLSVHFLKPLLQTKQQAIDSLIKVFHPGLINAETVEDAAKKLQKALAGEDILSKDAVDAAAEEIKVVADRDIRSAYTVLMAYTSSRPQELMTKLTQEQKDKIRVFANGFLEAYKNGTKFDIKTFDPNPPAPVFNNIYSYNTGKGVYAAPPEPETVRVRCAVCSGTGQYEKVMYSHTYNGIAADITTQRTHWVICEFCNGTGWVTKTKKRK